MLSCETSKISSTSLPNELALEHPVGADTAARRKPGHTWRWRRTARRGIAGTALTRLLNLVPCADVNAPPDLPALSASYTAGLAKTSPFIDGNKRAAFLATGLFLCLNSYRLEASQADATITMRAVDTGNITEDVFANWLRRHIHIKLLK